MFYSASCGYHFDFIHDDRPVSKTVEKVSSASTIQSGGDFRFRLSSYISFNLPTKLGITFANSEPFLIYTCSS